MKAMEISTKASFEEAIAFTESLLEKMESNQLSDTEITQAIASLVQFPNGARGFFVTYLTTESSLPDHPSPSVIKALASSPAIVADLLVKNLAMSSAMAITHLRNDNQEMAESSQRVTRRTGNLIELLNLDLITQELTHLRETIQNGSGKYQDFLQRWGYDSEQLQVIGENVELKIEN